MGMPITTIKTTQVISQDQFVNGARDAVLDALDTYVRGLTGHPKTLGATDAELPALFEGIDKHARLVHARLVGAEVLSPTPNGLHVEAD